MISSSRNSSMRRRSSRNSDISTFSKIASSVQRFAMATSNLKKKDDDWSEAWTPSKSKIADLEGGSYVKKQHKQRRATDNIFKVILALVACCVFGALLGWMRGAKTHQPAVKLVTSDDSSSKDLIDLARDGKFKQLHSMVKSTIESKCGKSLSALDNEDYRFNFRAHVLDLVQYIADGGKFAMVNPVVSSQGGIVDKLTNTGEKTFQCVLLNEFKELSASNSKQMSGHDWTESYDDWAKISESVLTGHVGHDARTIVMLASQGKIYDVEMDLRKATQTHCNLGSLSERARYTFHLNVMDVLDQLITHRKHFIGVSFEAGISKKDGTLLDISTPSGDDEYFLCPFITETIRHSTASLESASKSLIDEILAGDYYGSELQTDLLILQFGQKTIKSFNEKQLESFRAHYIDLALVVASGDSLGKEPYRVLPDGAIATKNYALNLGHTNKEIKACALVDAMVSLGDTGHKSTVEGKFSGESQEYVAEQEYLKSHKNDADPDHDAKYLLERAAFKDGYAIEASLTNLLNVHCSFIQGSSKRVQENAHDSVAALLWSFSGDKKQSVNSPRFSQAGDVISSNSQGNQCSLLSSIVKHGISGDFRKPSPDKKSKSSETQPKKSEIKSSSENTKTSTSTTEEDSVFTPSSNFLKKNLAEQAATVVKQIRSNDWYDAEVNLWYMIETHCDQMLQSLTGASAEDINTATTNFYHEISGYMQHIAFNEIKQTETISVDSKGQLWVGKGTAATTCPMFTSFQHYAIQNPPTVEQKTPDITDDELNKLLHSEGHESHLDDVTQDINLLIGDVRLGHVVDMEKDVESDLRTHCPSMMSNLRTSARRNLHAKIVQAAEWIASGNFHKNVDAVVTSSGVVKSRTEATKANDRIFECSFVSNLYAR